MIDRKASHVYKMGAQMVLVEGLSRILDKGIIIVHPHGCRCRGSFSGHRWRLNTIVHSLNWVRRLVM